MKGLEIWLHDILIHITLEQKPISSTVLSMAAQRLSVLGWSHTASFLNSENGRETCKAKKTLPDNRQHSICEVT